MASSGHRKRPRYRPYVLPFIIFFNKTLPYPSYVVAVALIGSHFVVFFSLFVVDDDDDVLPLIELCFFFIYLLLFRAQEIITERPNLRSTRP